MESVGDRSRAVLINRTRKPVEEADLENLVEQFYPRILRAAIVMTGNRWEADDLAQETFLQAMRSWPRFGRRSGVDTWLYSILLNVHRKRVRSARRRWQRWLGWFRRTDSRRVADSPDAAAQWAEWRESLWAAVARLPEPQQHAVVLRYSEGLSYAQIAEVLECPIGTVKSRLHHGLAALQKRLGGPEAVELPPPEARATRKLTR